MLRYVLPPRRPSPVERLLLSCSDQVVMCTNSQSLVQMRCNRNLGSSLLFGEVGEAPGQQPRVASRSFSRSSNCPRVSPRNQIAQAVPLFLGPVSSIGQGPPGDRTNPYYRESTPCVIAFTLRGEWRWLKFQIDDRSVTKARTVARIFSGGERSCWRRSQGCFAEIVLIVSAGPDEIDGSQKRRRGKQADIGSLPVRGPSIHQI